ncbi:MAG: hypothetical protein JXR70_15990 [Spirochaetales bacterium]|nr:hypothetical protein [Spirochaetales bacterium]
MSDQDFTQFSEGSFRSDTDLSDMDIDSAKEYVVSFVTSLKQTQRKIYEVMAELKTWLDRKQFAQEKNRPDLVEAAQGKIDNTNAQLNTLKTEEQDLAAKVQEMMANLKKLKNGFTPTINAEQLLAELEMITGGKDEVADQFKEEDVLNELERLKAKMEEENK